VDALAETTTGGLDLDDPVPQFHVHVAAYTGPPGGVVRQ
jgi:hypothetical protein